jgi:hypothetical protein
VLRIPAGTLSHDRGCLGSCAKHPAVAGLLDVERGRIVGRCGRESHAPMMTRRGSLSGSLECDEAEIGRGSTGS